MRRNHSRRWRTAAFWLGVAICVAAGLGHGARRSTAQQQPQDNRQIGIQAGNNAQTQRKVALVIGNGAYANIRKLRNPANDAADLATTFKDNLGFELVGGGAGVNLSKVEMEQRIAEFGKQLRAGGVGV